MNAASARYRTLTVHLEKGFPALAGGDANVDRVRRSGQPRRKENGMGQEFSAAVDPPAHQTHWRMALACLEQFGR